MRGNDLPKVTWPRAEEQGFEAEMELIVSGGAAGPAGGPQVASSTAAPGPPRAASEAGPIPPAVGMWAKSFPISQQKPKI